MMHTPYFFIHKDILLSNINDFKSALGTYWPNSKLAYSVKTNSLPWLLKFLKKEDILAEVVSDEEYQLARLCSYNDSEIIFNGPIKGEKIFEKAIINGAVINLDSKCDLKFLKTYVTEDSLVGIRINIPPQIFAKEDIGYCEEGFRFGYSDETGDLQRVLQLIHTLGKNIRIGIHVHCNSITRSIDVYQQISKYVARLIQKYNLELAFIDIGGGFFGGVEGKPTPVDYILAIQKELIGFVDFNQTTLILEPGSAIIGSAVDLHTTVLDIKDTGNARIVTTDGSRIHIDPLWKKEKYMYSVNVHEKRRKLVQQIICGYTCMDHDRIMKITNTEELLPGDEIIYHRVGAYTMTFGGMFIRYFPDVYVQEKEKQVKVRSKISVEDYYKIHSVEMDKGE